MRACAIAVAVLLLALAACGDDRSATRKAMDLKFDSIDYEMANFETLTATYGPHLTRATHQYIALVRKYADELGPDEAKRRLVEKGDEVAPYCLPCTGMLNDEAERY